MEAEFRAEIRERLALIERAVSADGSLHSRVRKLESDRGILIGALVVIQAIGATAIALAVKFFKT